MLHVAGGTDGRRKDSALVPNSAARERRRWSELEPRVARRSGVPGEARCFDGRRPVVRSQVPPRAVARAWAAGCAVGRCRANCVKGGKSCGSRGRMDGWMAHACIRVGAAFHRREKEPPGALIRVLLIAIGVLIIAIGTCKRQGRRRFQSSRGRGCRTPPYRVRSTQHRP